MKINIIFLDIDGVLNTGRNQELQEEKDGEMKFDHQFNFAEECMKNLKRIVLKYDAYIVISSSWRIEKESIYWDSIITNLKMYNIEDRIIDKTPSFSTIRGEEIKRWLNDNCRKINNYVILDDEDDMIDLRNYLVLCDDYYGFNYKTEIEAEKILERARL